MDEQSSVDLIVALARVWAAVRKRHPDVPGVVLLPAPNPHKDNNVLGHFAALRWSPRKSPGSTLVHEVVVVAEHLNRSPADIVETLLHEAAHAMNFERGIKDCSSTSQYHNQHFKAAAEELGLTVSQVRHYGFAMTMLLPDTAALYEAETEALAAVLMHRRSITRAPSAPPGPSPPGNVDNAGDDKEDNKEGRMKKAVCSCGFIIRASRKVLASTTISCGRCAEPFVLA